MYGIAYVIIPTEFASLQAALDEALSPFRRGGPDLFPREALALDDVTETNGGFTARRSRWRRKTPALLQRKDFAVRRRLRFCRAARLPPGHGRADVERKFRRRRTRLRRLRAPLHQVEGPRPRAGGYGRWLNPFGRWDWWELGGRFDGVVAESADWRLGAELMICRGQTTGAHLGEPRAPSAESHLKLRWRSPPTSTSHPRSLEAGRRGEEHAFPTAILSPVGACAPESRWFDALGWRPIASND